MGSGTYGHTLCNCALWEALFQLSLNKSRMKTLGDPPVAAATKGMPHAV